MSVYYTDPPDASPRMKQGKAEAEPEPEGRQRPPGSGKRSLRARRAAVRSGTPGHTRALPFRDPGTGPARDVGRVLHTKRRFPLLLFLMAVAVFLVLAAGAVSFPVLLLSGPGAAVSGQDDPEHASAPYSAARESLFSLGDETARSLRYRTGAASCVREEQAPDFSLLAPLADAVLFPSGDTARLDAVCASLAQSVSEVLLTEDNGSGTRSTTVLRYHWEDGAAVLDRPVSLFPDTVSVTVTVRERPLTESDILACLEPDEAERYSFYAELRQNT